MNTSPVLRCCTILLVLLLLSSSTKQGSEARVPRCCTKKSNTKIQLELLKRYIIQENSLCPIKAIRFITVKETTICSDPSSRWAIKAKEYLDRKQRSEQSLGTTLQTTT